VRSEKILRTGFLILDKHGKKKAPCGLKVEFEELEKQPLRAIYRREEKKLTIPLSKHDSLVPVHFLLHKLRSTIVCLF
jgi:hypothetical protein